MRLHCLWISSLVVFAAAGARADTFPKEATIKEIHGRYRAGTLTPAQLVQMYLDRINAFDHSSKPQPFGNGLSDQPLNSFMHVNADALRDASRLDEDDGDDDGERPLFGIPVILKDNVATKDMPTTAGSVALGASRPKKDATIAKRIRQAGAIILGKGTLTEFANFIALGMPAGFDSQLRFQLFSGVPGSDLGKIGYGYNPYDTRLDTRPGAFDGRPAVTTGGSSSGPGIAVAANLVTIGIGTETSGSILSPSSANFLVGIKPTLGLVSRHGIVPITEDQDTAGPLARTVTDAAKLLGVIAGFDEKDPATAECLKPGNCFKDYTRFLDPNALKGAVIAVPRHPFFTVAFGLSPNRDAVMEQVIKDATAQGATFIDCDIPSQSFLNNFGSCVTTSDVQARRANTGPHPAPCSTVLLNGFKNHLNDYLADKDFGPGVSVSNSQIPVRTIHNLSDIIAFNATATHPNNPEVQMKYAQDIAIGADFLTTQQQDVDDYKADRAFDLLLSRTCGFEILFTGHVPTGKNGEVDCTPFIQDWLTANAQPGVRSCVGVKFDAALFPANFGAAAPAKGGYPSVAVPAGVFQFTTVFPGFPAPPFSPIDATFTGPRFSEPKLIGFAFALEQGTLHAPASHRTAPPDPKLP
jgi:amidase